MTRVIMSRRRKSKCCSTFLQFLSSHNCRWRDNFLKLLLLLFLRQPQTFFKNNDSEEQTSGNCQRSLPLTRKPKKRDSSLSSVEEHLFRTFTCTEMSRPIFFFLTFFFIHSIGRTFSRIQKIRNTSMLKQIQKVQTHVCSMWVMPVHLT